MCTQSIQRYLGRAIAQDRAIAQCYSMYFAGRRPQAHYLAFTFSDRERLRQEKVSANQRRQYGPIWTSELIQCNTFLIWMRFLIVCQTIQMFYTVLKLEMIRISRSSPGKGFHPNGNRSTNIVAWNVPSRWSVDGHFAPPPPMGGWYPASHCK